MEIINEFEVENNIKKRIKENVENAIKEYENRDNVTTKFGTPIIGYVSVKHPLFWEFFDNDLCMHPKGIYRPGNTCVVHFVPYSKEVTESNRGGKLPSKEWSAAYYDGMHLSMYLNRIISDTLDEVGRLHSGTTIPTDWNEETYRPEWSHKLVAYIAGIGRFGIGGSFHTELGFAGTLGSLLVDAEYDMLDDEELEYLCIDETIEDINSDSKYLGADFVKVSDEAIKACPIGAITKDGIDQKKCQEHCKKINDYIPSPEVCGKCFFYDR